MMRYLLTFLFILSACWGARAQQDDYGLHPINLPERFSQQIIVSLTQDRLGLLWFVTSEGLFRFDGNEVIQLGPESTPRIGHASIKVLFADSKDQLWVGAQDGITRLDLKTWQTTTVKTPKKAAPLSLYIRCLTEDSTGQIFAGSQDGRVYKVDNDSLVSIFDMNQAFRDLYDLPNITFIATPSPGTLWVGTSVGKVIRLDQQEAGRYLQTGVYSSPEWQSGLVTAASFGPKGNILLVVSGEGLYYLDAARGEIRKMNSSYGDLGADGQVFMTALDSARTLLMTNTPGIGKEKLFVYDFTTGDMKVASLRYPPYLEDNHIVSLSHSGAKVILTLNDFLLELAPLSSPFTALMASGNSLNSIRAIYRTPEGVLLAGSYKDGFVRYEEKTGEKRVIDRKYIYGIMPWNKDTVVLSSEGDGLYWYEVNPDRLTRMSIDPVAIQGKPMGEVLTILHRYDASRFLVGTYERLYLVDPYHHSARAVREDRLLKARVLNILKRDSDYLIATEQGILSWDDRTDQIRSFADAGNADYRGVPIYGMVEVDAQIWAATSGQGIIIYDAGGRSVDTISKATGLAANIVFNIAATDQYVLAGTKNGLSVIDRKSGEISNYSTVDLLPANEFNSAALFQQGDDIYMGTIDGIVRFNTTQLGTVGSKAAIGPLYVTDFMMTDKKGNTRTDYTMPYRPAGPIVVPASATYFSLGFGSMTGEREPLDYYYRLEERQSWTPVGSNLKVSFVGMSPGHYQMDLVAKMPDGSWSTLLASLPIIVQSAFYQTIWFKLLIALVAAALIWGIVKYRERQAERERALRLKIAGDLHDEIGSTLAGMSMQAEMLLSGHHQHQRAYLKSIADNGRAAVQTMGDIVWSIDPRNDDSMSLFQRMELYGNRLLETSDITIRLKSHGFSEKQHIPQQIRQNVMLIYKEAITNVIKHAAASLVEVEFSAYQRGFQLRITDNGKGMKEPALTEDTSRSSGHGLRNMAMRAKMMNATLSFPKTDQGFSILLTFKGAQ